MSKLTLAIPAKGRLKEQTAQYLRAAGMELKAAAGDRSYSAQLEGIDGLEVKLASAREIAEELSMGKLHLGITGQDMIGEYAKNPDKVHLLLPLEFGWAKLVVAVPRVWLDVENMADLKEIAWDLDRRTGEPLRIASKYINLTREFLARHDFGSYRLIASVGATEGAPAAGSADIIVDISTTGATLAANGLKILEDGEIMNSQAALSATLAGDGLVWDESALETLRALLDRLCARHRARTHDLLRFAGEAPPALIADGSLHMLGDIALCPVEQSAKIARKLTAIGSGPVLIDRCEYIYEATNPLFDGLIEALKKYGAKI